MSFFAKTDKAVAKEIGARLKALRLKKNLMQKEIARMTGLSVKAVQTAEKGESRLLTYIKILRALDALDALDSFLPVVNYSPLELARMEGKKRQRATRPRKIKE